MKGIREKRVLNISEGEFLVLLLVVQAQNNPPYRLVINRACEESLHLLIDVCPEPHDLIERWARKRSAQLFIRNLFPQRIVIAVEEPTEFLTKRFVVLQEWPQYESLKEPCSMGLMPFDRTCVRTGLEHLVLGGKTGRKRAGYRPHGMEFRVETGRC